METQRFHISSSKVHRTALRVHLLHHCGCFDWSEKALGAVRAQNYTQLVKLAKDVNERLFTYEDPTSNEPLGSPGSESPNTAYGEEAAKFLAARQFVAMVLKYPYTPEEIPGLDPDSAAIQKLMADEERNRKLNRILRCYRTRGLDRHPAFKIMRKFIVSVIGETPVFEQMSQYCDFSGGATNGVGGSATHLGNKMLSEGLTATPTALGYYIEAVWVNAQLREYYLREAHKSIGLAGSLNAGILSQDYHMMSNFIRSTCRIVTCNKISCVPKGYDCSRTIAAEATANGFVQAGVDQWMRVQLKRITGIDLSQQSSNQILAWLGSYESRDPYSTIDVKSASNSVIVELVRSLLPPEWFTFLNNLRSPAGEWPDNVVRRWQLFCSMGNGFCFPLETLIFAAVVHASYALCGQDPDYRVYGDDIVVKQNVSLLTMEILKSCGFRLNLDKTFIHGPFRESCGADWYKGHGVTPVYWRNRIATRNELFAIHNAHAASPPLQEALRAFDPELPFVVPALPMYRFITDQAFVAPMDICMSSSSPIYRTDTMSWRYRLLLSGPVMDQAWNDEFTQKGELFCGLRKHNIRRIAILRGSTFELAFPLRRSNRCRPLFIHQSMEECAASAFLRRTKKRGLSYVWAPLTGLESNQMSAEQQLAMDLQRRAILRYGSVRLRG